jgi:hypothetical protein
MTLPSEYSEIVGAGVNALRLIGGQLRTEAARRADAPELWLAVRDVEGLAERLSAMEQNDWLIGFINLMVTPQDFAVLDELVETRPEAPHRAALRVVSIEARDSLAFLSKFLRRCRDGEFDSNRPPA